MEKRKNFTKTRSFQMLCLGLFAGMALACTSAKDAQDAMDGFVDGYNYGRSLRSEINYTDSISQQNTMDVAMTDVHQSDEDI